MCGGDWANIIGVAAALLDSSTGPCASGSYKDATGKCQVATAGILGCFVNTSSRDLPYHASVSSGFKMTYSACANLCQTAGYIYFEAEAGVDCWCGNSFGAYGTASTCNYSCPGDTSKMCGGDWVGSVGVVCSSGLYLDAKGKCRAATSGMLGCFVDNSSRDLPYPANIDSSVKMTYSACSTLCKTAGYIYFGVEVGFECWCGNTFGKNGISTSCTTACTGDSLNKCGGTWALTVGVVTAATFSGHTLVITTASGTDNFLNLMEIYISGASNLAATLSDTLSGYPASNCVDGRTGTMCHSGSKSASLTITFTGTASSILVTNRSDAGQAGKDRINGATMSLDGNVIYVFPAPGANSYTVTASTFSGHTLIIRTAGGSDTLLNLMEVYILGAFNLKATLSDTLNSLYPASNCIDGNTLTMCHSLSATASLTITFTGTASSIHVTNRSDVGQPGEDRINGGKMYLDGSLIYTFPSPGVENYIVTTATYSGHTLIIRSAGGTDSFLNLMEVSISGASNLVATLSDTLSGYPASNCVDGRTGTMCHSESVSASLIITFTGTASSILVTNRSNVGQAGEDRINGATMSLDGNVIYVFPAPGAKSYTVATVSGLRSSYLPCSSNSECLSNICKAATWHSNIVQCDVSPGGGLCVIDGTGNSQGDCGSGKCTAGICVLSASGGQCAVTADCIAGLQCLGFQAGSTWGKCSGLKSAYVACSSGLNSECLSNICKTATWHNNIVQCDVSPGGGLCVIDGISGDCGTGKCTAGICVLSAIGGQCAVTADCTAGLQCLGFQAGTTWGKCSGLKSAYAACSLNSECLSNICKTATWHSNIVQCDVSPGGGLCVIDGTGNSQGDCGSGKCTAGICVLSASGGQCAVTADCTAGLQCVGFQAGSTWGKCSGLKSAYVACSTNSECLSNICSTAAWHNNIIQCDVSPGGGKCTVDGVGGDCGNGGCSSGVCGFSGITGPCAVTGDCSSGLSCVGYKAGSTWGKCAGTFTCPSSTWIKEIKTRSGTGLDYVDSIVCTDNTIVSVKVGNALGGSACSSGLGPFNRLTIAQWDANQSIVSDLVLSTATTSSSPCGTAFVNAPVVSTCPSGQYLTSITVAASSNSMVTGFSASCGYTSTQACQSGQFKDVKGNCYAAISGILGCFADDGSRDLPYPANIDPTYKMTYSACSTLCKTAGYTYFGVEVAAECWCGNTFGKNGISTSCTTACNGDSLYKCGGTWALTIGVACALGSYMDVNGSCKVSTAGLLGCYTNSSPRDLPYFTSVSSSFKMTYSACANLCQTAGYIYFEAEVGVDCWCGNSFGHFGTASTCNIACPGDTSTMCGGNLVGIVGVVCSSRSYLDAKGRCRAATSSGMLGCFVDNSSRDLPYPANIDSSVAMTYSTCANLCKTAGYIYFGVEVGFECYCGNTYGHLGISTSCTSACTGDSLSKCGGTWALTVGVVTAALSATSSLSASRVSGLTTTNSTVIPTPVNSTVAPTVGMRVTLFPINVEPDTIAPTVVNSTVLPTSLNTTAAPVIIAPTVFPTTNDAVTVYQCSIGFVIDSITLSSDTGLNAISSYGCRNSTGAYKTKAVNVGDKRVGTAVTVTGPFIGFGSGYAVSPDRTNAASGLFFIKSDGSIIPQPPLPPYGTAYSDTSIKSCLSGQVLSGFSLSWDSSHAMVGGIIGAICRAVHITAIPSTSNSTVAPTTGGGTFVPTTVNSTVAPAANSTVGPTITVTTVNFTASPTAVIPSTILPTTMNSTVDPAAVNKTSAPTAGMLSTAFPTSANSTVVPTPVMPSTILPTTLEGTAVPTTANSTVAPTAVTSSTVLPTTMNSTVLPTSANSTSAPTPGMLSTVLPTAANITLAPAPTLLNTTSTPAPLVSPSTIPTSSTLAPTLLNTTVDLTPAPAPETPTFPTVFPSAPTLLNTTAPTLSSTPCSARYEQCGGKSCCSDADTCVPQLGNIWYSQCLPNEHLAPTPAPANNTTPQPEIPVCSQLWEQCGGIAVGKPQCCVSGSICVPQLNNPWYSQCLPDSSAQPTAAPSESSISPTSFPSSPPTAISSPFEASSDAPTSTEAPTKEPTQRPTEVPLTQSPLPTVAPTSSESGEPTPVHSADSTVFPTQDSTVSSTEEPISAQTETPTGSPTASPTVEDTTSVPTDQPTSASETSAPSLTEDPIPSPTEEPITIKPTAAPTLLPSLQPTAAPTAGQTPVPTREPTEARTSLPTVTPTTVKPTTAPTAAPSLVPTPQPTASPTSLPTAEPSPAPTPVPTHSPEKPTSSPTDSPTSVPTHDPTSEPTEDHTPSPTEHPTSEPTEYPTEEPTDQPTVDPTPSPTASPTEEPSPAPTGLPTSSPTEAAVDYECSTGFVIDTITLRSDTGINAVSSYVCKDSAGTHKTKTVKVGDSSAGTSVTVTGPFIEFSSGYAVSPDPINAASGMSFMKSDGSNVPLPPLSPYGTAYTDITTKKCPSGQVLSGFSLSWDSSHAMVEGNIGALCRDAFTESPTPAESPTSPPVEDTTSAPEDTPTSAPV